MARLVYIPIPNDATVPTLYYECFYRQDGNPNYSRVVPTSPLIDFVTLSPAGSTPCISLGPLPDNTDYNFKVRRFDLNNNPSAFTSGTFNTGS